MTIQQIYDTVVFNLWGNTGAPAGMVAQILRIIEQCHRQVQEDYNYWFMHTWADIDCVAGTQSYALPALFKEQIAALWETIDANDDPNGFSKTLQAIGLGDGPTYLWQRDGTAVEYPEYIEITGDNLVIYDDLAEARTLYLVYWTFLSFPADLVTEDALTQYGDWVLINMSSYRTAAQIKDWEAVQFYKGEYNETLESLKNEDRRRRQAPITEVTYNEY